MIRAGQLKDFVTIRKPSATPDTSGQRSGWEEHAKVYAEVVQLQGRELIAARQLVSNVTTRVRIRYNDGLGVNGGMQVLVDDRTLDILSIIDIDRKHVAFELLCSEAV